jgi:hypothetical protein
MTLLDRIFASASLIAFGAYLLVVITKVPRFGLVAVVIVAFALAAFDFGLLLSRRRRMNRRDGPAAPL